MAQQTAIKIRRSSVASKIPLTTDLVLGELALNTYDGVLYFKKSPSGTDSIVAVVTLDGTQTLTNKTLTSPTINSGALSGTFTGAITLSDTTASTSTTTGALKIGGGLGVAGTIYADKIYLTNNGAGTNVAVGANAWLGDINQANSIGVRGQQDPHQGYIVFGDSNNTNYIGRNGTNPLQVTGQFKVDSGTVTGSSAIALQITGYANKGGTGYHDFLSVTNGYVSATNPSKFFRLSSDGQLQIINSAYSSNIFNLTDAGELTVPSFVLTGTFKDSTGSVGTNNQILSSTATGTKWITSSSGSSGTVTSVSVVSANGFTGTVANSTTTPAITLTTSINGLLKGNGTAISAATAGTDYIAPYGSTTANYVLAAPNGSAGTPTFRALVAADIPNLSYAPTAGSASITTLGTITSGTWQGTIVGPTYGGTGVNNGSSTITLGGNFTTSGAFTTTLTATANTSVTLPTSGTLATTAQSFYIGTTSVAINQASANLALTGISSVAFAGSTSGTSTLQAQATAGTTTFTLPTTTGTLIGSGDSATVSNTMLANPSFYIGTTSVSLGATSGSITSLAVNISGSAANLSGTQTQNYVYAAPSGSNGSASFRALVAADIPPVTNIAGGTTGAIHYQSSANTTTFLTGNSTTTPQFVTSTGTGSAAQAPTLTSSTGTGNVVLATSPSITTSLTTASTSFDLINTTATTVNFAKAATALSIGASTGTTTVNNDLTVTGNLTVNGTTEYLNSTTVQVADKNIELGKVTVPTDTTANGGGITLKGATDKTLNWVSSTSSWTSSENFDLASGKVYNINGTSVLSATTLGSGVTASSLTSVGTLTGLTVNGSSATSITNSAGGTFFTIASASRPASGTQTWSFWTNTNIGGPSSYIQFPDSTTQLTAYPGTATSLGSGIVSSSLTSVGTIATGVWNGTIISSTYGGTGVNNGSNTITVGGNVTYSGAYTQTFTATGNTSVTLPTTGTLATLAGSETLSSKTLASVVLTGTVTAGGGVGTSGQVLSSTGTGVQWIDAGGAATAVSYASQTLTTAQQTQARANINAASPDDAYIYSLIF
jgi:hypothetical protein